MVETISSQVCVWHVRMSDVDLVVDDYFSLFFHGLESKQKIPPCQIKLEILFPIFISYVTICFSSCPQEFAHFSRKLISNRPPSGCAPQRPTVPLFVEEISGQFAALRFSLISLLSFFAWINYAPFPSASEQLNIRNVWSEYIF